MFCLTYKQMGEPADEDALLSCPMDISEGGRHDYQHVMEEEVKKKTTLLGGNQASLVLLLEFLFSITGR